MKLFVSSVLSTLVLYLVSSAFGSPYPEIKLKTFNASDNELTTRGEDPSYTYNNWAAVEIWTSYQPVNFGDLRGQELYDKVVEKLQKLCPYSSTRVCSRKYDSRDWLDFETYTPDSHGNHKAKKAWVRIENGVYGSKEGLQMMIELAALTLKAYVSQDDGYNCWKASDGHAYCNVPRTVRVHLPPYYLKHEEQDHKEGWVDDGLLIETWGTDEGNQFGDASPDYMKPCQTRQLVDEVMDSMKDRLVTEFPEWKDRFRRETRVIIDGFRICNGEP